MKTLFKFTAVFLLLTSCQVIKITTYDSYSHQKAIELKAKTNTLALLSTNAYTNHQEEANLLINELNSHLDYEKNKPNNEVTVMMWSKIAGNEQTLLPKFLSLWKQNNKLNPSFAGESAKQFNEAFDQIIILETAKQK
ncbi:hypothetical protein NAT51_01535 [Flavobacterium amniphilum]|uniref:hypothetical protein n=1 Tax=Flavobacterium amniphilum TaxID=1834035 RepID=UPI00202A7897|nr:hypothetical protein [Flavobacterium amniphilum]MCL9804188.1 hypothetical protein [Flavobacterium amniphilum]